MPKTVTSTEEFQQEVDQSENNLVVVEYFTDWCTKCSQTINWIEDLEQKYEHAVFLRIDCDTLPRLAQSKKIRVVPTYHFYKKGIMVERLVGAIKPDLYRVVKHQVPHYHHHHHHRSRDSALVRDETCVSTLPSEDDESKSYTSSV